MGTSRDGDELFRRADLLSIAHQPKSSGARAKLSAAQFSVQVHPLQLRCVLGAGSIPMPACMPTQLAPASYEDFSVVPFNQLAELGKIVPKWGFPLPVWKNSRVSRWCQDCVGSAISSLQLTTGGRDAADPDGAVELPVPADLPVFPYREAGGTLPCFSPMAADEVNEHVRHYTGVRGLWRLTEARSKVCSASSASSARGHGPEGRRDS